jgi:ubiquinone/menaquinone biosynthesis C-methylase UbiE
MPTKASVNYWPDSRCAKAFWNQHELPPYQELLANTIAWLEPRRGERWLDLGCGSGQLSRALWVQSRGQVAEIVGTDCAALNEKAYRILRQTVRPRCTRNQIRFLTADFSRGLPGWEDARFHGVVSGLAIQYAEAYCEATGQWTKDGYDLLLAEDCRVLRPGGRFIFSVNVPEPSWGRIAWRSLGGTFRARKPLRYLQKAWRIWRYGSWLRRESRRGRFHYLPREVIVRKLHLAGFDSIEQRLSFAGQAYLFRCRKPVCG